MPVLGTPTISPSSVVVKPKTTFVYGQAVATKMQSLIVQQGQTAAIQTIIKDVNGKPVDLTSYSGSNIVMRIAEAVGLTGSLFSDISVLILNATAGLVGTTLTADVVSYAGISIAEIAFLDTSSNNLILSNRYYLVVDATQFGLATTRQGPPTMMEIRMHIRDNAPEDNYLLDEIEFDDAELAASITRPIMQFNEMPPPSDQLYNTATFPYRYHWLEAIVANLYMIAAAHYRRNQLAYSAAGLSIDDKNKEKQYLEIAAYHKKNWEDFAKATKVRANMEAGFGTILSGYSYFNWNTY